MKKLLLIFVMMIMLVGCNEEYYNCNKVGSGSGSAQSVPEPGTFILLGVGLVALAGVRRVRK